jgi:hypothetical protein
MVRRADATIGFFALRHEPDHVYVQTIERIAGGEVRLRVFHANAAARRFYERLGYTPLADDGHAMVLARRVNVNVDVR